MDEAELVPLYYSVPRNLTITQIEQVLHIFKITPVSAAIITDIDDLELAQQLSEEVRQVSTLPDAFELAKTFGEPAVIVTKDTEFYAHYSNGTPFQISLEAQI